MSRGLNQMDMWNLNDNGLFYLGTLTKEFLYKSVVDQITPSPHQGIVRLVHDKMTYLCVATTMTSLGVALQNDTFVFTNTLYPHINTYKLHACIYTYLYMWKIDCTFYPKNA